MNILIALIILTTTPEDLYVTKSPDGGTIYITCEYMERYVINEVYRAYREGDKLIVVCRDGSNHIFNWVNVIRINNYESITE